MLKRRGAAHSRSLFVKCRSRGIDAQRLLRQAVRACRKTKAEGVELVRLCNRANILATRTSNFEAGSQTSFTVTTFFDRPSHRCHNAFKLRCLRTGSWRYVMWKSPIVIDLSHSRLATARRDTHDWTGQRLRGQTQRVRRTLPVLEPLSGRSP